MRKNVKRIIIWILISLVAQVSVLFYAENFIFTDAASKAKFKKVEEKKEAAVQPYEAIADMIKNNLMQQKQSEVFANEVERLKGQYRVEFYK